MKKSKKIILRVIPIVLMLVVIVTTSVFASSPISPNVSVGEQGIGKVNTAVNKTWSTVVLILQILAVAAVVFAGVRYMFASADTKADIKMQMIILVIGAVLVFGATTVISFIQNVAKDVLQ